MLWIVIRSALAWVPAKLGDLLKRLSLWIMGGRIVVALGIAHHPVFGYGVRTEKGNIQWHGSVETAFESLKWHMERALEEERGRGKAS